VVNFNLPLSVAITCEGRLLVVIFRQMKKLKFLRNGSIGKAVADIQRRLKKLGYAITDNGGVFNSSTEIAVKQFQQDRGLLVDGIVGNETWQDLVEAGYILGDRPIYLKNPYLAGDDIKTVQLWLRTVGFNPGPIDGIYGQLTEAAVKEFQTNVGVRSDGIISTDTIEAFLNLRATLEKNASVEFPEHEIDPQSSLAALEKQEILIDFGHGGNDKGAIGQTGLSEMEICEDIGLRVGNLFKILGSKVTYTREMGQGRTTARRIEFINNSNAPLVISIHLNHSTNAKAEGSSCYYFAKGNIYSIEGKKIANCLQKEQVSALGMKDCRVHGKNFNILRLTKIPAVIVEPVFITNPKEEGLLKKQEFRQKIATAIFDGLKRYFKKSLL
jgi:N-acetylmuramoyl-L-alanine amidase